MPIYEYACDKCGHEFEREQRITEDPVKKCPSCRSSRVRRLISATSFVLKGGGWYSDLYASKKGEGAEKSDAKPADASSASPDSTPAAKAESAPAEKKPAAGGAKGGKKKKASPAAA